MNILYICNEYPPGNSGGIGSATRNLADEMVNNGHKVFVAGLYAPGYGQKNYEEKEGVKIWRKRLNIDVGLIRNDFSKRDTVILHLLRVTGVLKGSYRAGIKKFLSFLQELIKQYQIDIVEWPDFNECFQLVPAMPLAEWLPVPVIVKLHGSSSYIKHQTGQPVDGRIYSAEQKHIQSANAIVAVSRHTAMQYAGFYQINQEIKVLYNSVKTRPVCFQQDNSRPTIVFAGSLSLLKGLGSLLKAWNNVHEKYPDAVLNIYGKGKPENFIHFLNNKAKSSISFLGYKDCHSIIQAFSTASAAIFPGYTECFSVVPLEAMSNGCPVIFTTRASGPELINNGVNGLLVDPDDQDAIVTAICSLIADNRLREKFSENGIETIKRKFNLSDSAFDHLEFYQTVIDQYKTGGRKK